jgi:uncharacterized membrane protein YkgB
VITHTSGTGTATYAASIVAGYIDKLVLTATGRTAGSVTPTVGGATGAACAVATVCTYELLTTTTGGLILTPTTTFNGSITVSGAGALTLKRVIGGDVTAHGKFNVGGLPGVTATGTTCTITAVTGGIITAASCI